MKKYFVVFVLLMIFIIPAIACEPVMTYENGVYHIVLNSKMAKKIQFVSSEKLITNKKAHEIFNSDLTINTGFFDPKNQKTISFIIENNGEKVLNPLNNENLTSNPVLRKNMDKILNRTEFRVLKCGRKYKYEIVPHSNPITEGCYVSTSAQGGPLILPELRMEEEFFIVKDSNGKVIRESASVLHKTARTIIALKGDEVHIFIITCENPMTLKEVQDYCKEMGMDRAMAFDGGSSTSLNYKDVEVVSAKNSSARRLKSFMTIKF